MKTITTQLSDLFTTRQFQLAGLYQFDLSDSTTLYYCDGDVDIFLDSSLSGGDAFWADQTFSCGGTGGVGPYFSKTGGNKAKLHQKAGLEVDTLAFDMTPAAAQIGGIDFLQAARQGTFDGAELTWLGAYWPLETFVNPVVPTGTVLKFLGRVASVPISRSLVTFNCNSHLELLNQSIPRNFYQAGCNNTLYDASCALVKASFAAIGTVASGSTASSIKAALGAATGYYDLGSASFTSGENAGVVRGVKAYTHAGTSTFTLISPLPNTPQIGDEFTIYPGCDKTQTTCTTKFSNLVNFRGMPYVPENSTAV